MTTKPTILLLDDEPLNLLLLEHALRADGMPAAELAIFDDPIAALTWCGANRPEICLIDYCMPGMDGLEFLRQVRRLPGFDAVPVIMLTAAPDPVVRESAFALGAQDFIRKPYEAAELQRRLRPLFTHAASDFLMAARA
jgi:CheY-like chemotaxis protein